MATGGVTIRVIVAAAAAALAIASAGVSTAAVAADTSAATQPSAASTTRPDDARAASIARWVRELADRDPDVREHARVQLMGLDRPGLDTLREVVADNRPLGPGQAAALQEIVSHVFLSAERDEPAEGAGGFLGVQLAPAGVEVSAPQAQQQQQQQQRQQAAQPRPDDAKQVVGVAVAGRVPGYCGYRMLEDGDVILSLTAAGNTAEFHSTSDLIAAIGQHHAGDRLTLGVLRRGKLVQVPVTLDARPAWVGQLVPAAEAMGPRQRRAAEYWDQAFAPLLKDGTS